MTEASAAQRGNEGIVSLGTRNGMELANSCDVGIHSIGALLAQFSIHGLVVCDSKMAFRRSAGNPSRSSGREYLGRYLPGYGIGAETWLE